MNEWGWVAGALTAATGLIGGYNAIRKLKVETRDSVIESFEALRKAHADEIKRLQTSLDDERKAREQDRTDCKTQIQELHDQIADLRLVVDLQYQRYSIKRGRVKMYRTDDHHES